MTKFDDLMNAGKAAAERTNELLKNIKTLGAEDISRLVEQLRRDAVDNAEITALIGEIESATNKNEKIANIYEKGGEIAKKIIDALKKIF